MPTDPPEPTHSLESNASPRNPQGTPPLAAPELFASSSQTSQPQERHWLPWAVAAAIVVAGLGLLALFGKGHPAATSSAADAMLQPSAYAPNLLLSDIHLSQAENFAGSQVTYVDGTITNRGQRTVTGITVAVAFANDAGEPPQVETIPLLLIRAHQPYVDTEPVSAAPLAPGDTREFRLIFDDISPLWNQQAPEIRVLGVR
jgi:hypothetical protein